MIQNLRKLVQSLCAPTRSIRCDFKNVALHYTVLLLYSKHFNCTDSSKSPAM